MNYKCILVMLCTMVFVVLMSACNNTQVTNNTEIQDIVSSSEITVITDVTEQTEASSVISIADTDTDTDTDTEQTESVEIEQVGSNVDSTIIAEIIDAYKNNEQLIAIEIKYADLNADGIDELFVKHYEYVGASFCGWLSIYDVTSNVEPVVKVCINNIVEEGLYKDAENQVHYIVRGDWWGQSDSYFMACFDITINGLTVPLCGIANWWYDPGFECNYAVYKNVGYEVENGYTYGDYGFIKEEENFVGYFESTDIKDTNDTNVDSVEFSQLVDENVYAGMERIGDVINDVGSAKMNGTFDTDVDAVIAQHYNIEVV